MCPYPIWLPHLFVYVACGQCLQCRIQKTRQWSLRVQQEANYWKESVFVTLTYSPEYIPNPPTIAVRELQLFFKRLRKNSRKKIAYYACGEYGEKNDRPHYHAIIFGVSPREKKLLQDCWQKGFVNLGIVTYDSIRYVAQYIDKKFISIETKEVYQRFGLRQPFQLVSKGLGLRWAMENKEELKQNGFMLHNGHEVGLPRYYKDKLEIDKNILTVRSEQYWKTSFRKWIKKVNWDGRLDTKSRYFSDTSAKAVQSEANLQAKQYLTKSRRKL